MEKKEVKKSGKKKYIILGIVACVFAVLSCLVRSDQIKEGSDTATVITSYFIYAVQGVVVCFVFYGLYLANKYLIFNKDSKKKGAEK